MGEPFTATYDSGNHLTSLAYAGGIGGSSRMVYTYLGNMLIKKQRYWNRSLAEERRYVYDGFRIIQERDAKNHLVNEFTYGLGLPGGIGGLLQLNQGGAWYSYLYDGKGNVTALLDGVGQVAQSYKYDEFGVYKSASGSLNQPMRFSTKPYDEQTGLSYYGFRFYAPALGRWMTRDPIGESGGINLYGFVGNNPVNWIDLLGLVNMNMMPSSQSMRRSYFNNINYDDIYTVAAHGRPDRIFDEHGNRITPEELACRIRRDLKYKLGMPVELYCCSTGQGDDSFAEKLAKELGAPVSAPTNDIQVHDGIPVPGRPDLDIPPWMVVAPSNTSLNWEGGFHPFLPGKK